AVEISAALLSVSAPELKAATIARMPMLSIIIEIRSSIRPKPSSDRRDFTPASSAGSRRTSRGPTPLPIPTSGMAAYAYNAINSLGVESLGEVHAPDPAAAREQLRVRGLLATHLRELPSAGEDSARTAFKKIKPK